MAWAIVQPAYLTYIVFAFVALGMASPYLLVGLFPRLVRLLPKPGDWMVTFKQIMGFVLLATVVFLLSFIPAPTVVPTVLALLGVGFGCWWVGRVPFPESRARRVRAWGVAVACVAATAWLSFGWLDHVMSKRFDRAVERRLLAAADHPAHGEMFSRPDRDGIAWEPFSKHRLEELVNGGKTVFVDFTADWCLTCKTNERVAIKTRDVSDLVRDYGIVPLKADWTEESDEIKDMLNLLGRNSIPVYAIFPADRPNQPIVFSDLVTKGQVLARLREAGPSKDASSRTALKPAR